jgi:hypothetical protein
MGRSLHMNEALVFIIIIIATILEGILGALLVVPLFATAIVVTGYIQRKILGLPPFEDDGSQQFVMPEEKFPPRKWGRRATDRLENEPVATPSASLPKGEQVPVVDTGPAPDRVFPSAGRVEDVTVLPPSAPTLDPGSAFENEVPVRKKMQK